MVEHQFEDYEIKLFYKTFGSILSSEERFRTFLSIPIKGGISTDGIINNAGVPRSSVYKFVRDLKDEDIIEKIGDDFYLTKLGTEMLNYINNGKEKLLPIKREVGIKKIVNEISKRFGDDIGNDVEDIIRKKLKEYDK